MGNFSPSSELSLDWQRVLAGESCYHFYHCAYPLQVCQYAQHFAEEVGAQHYCIGLNEVSALNPFAGVLAFFRKQMQQQALSAADVAAHATNYLPLRQQLECWLSEQPIERRELLIPDDLYFEQQALYKALCAIAQLLITQPTVLAIERFHLASSTMLAWLKFLVENAGPTPVLLMVSIDNHEALLSREEDEQWTDFQDWIEDHFILMQPQCTAEQKPKHLSPCFSLPDDQALSLEVVESNLQLFAWQEAIQAGYLLLEREGLSPREKLDLRLSIAKALLFAGQADQALSELEKLRESTALQTSTSCHIHLLCLSCLCLVQQQDFEYALQHVNAAQKASLLIGDDRLYAQVRFISFYVHDKSSTPIQLHEFERLISALERYQMGCSLLYCLRNYYTYLRFYDELASSEALKVTQRAIGLAREMQHLQGIAASYHSKGIIFSYMGHYSSAFRCFSVSSKLRQRLGEADEIVRMHNGAGYLYTLLERYPEALAEYQQAYQLTRQQDDHNELLVSLYNFAWLYFCTGNYAKASPVLDCLTRICRIRRISHFPFRNLYDVFSLKGLCHAKLGEHSRAAQCFSRMEGLPYEPSKLGRFMQLMLQGVLLSCRGMYKEAEQVLEHTPNALSGVIDMDSRFIPTCELELLEVKAQLGKWRDCERLLEKNLLQCERLSLPILRQHFSSFQHKVIDKQPFSLGCLPHIALNDADLSLSSLVSLAKQSVSLNQANQRLREVQLVSRLQSLAERYQDPKNLAEETLKLVCGNFSVQVGRIYCWSAEGWKLWNMVGAAQQEKHLDECLAKVMETGTIHVASSICARGELGQRTTYDSTIALPLFCDGELYACLSLSYLNSGRYFDRQNQDTLHLLAQQLGSLLQQLAHRERLMLMSTTDSLTDLANRQALRTKLQDTLKELGKRGSERFCSVAFIDLDYFKSINDSLGHEVGDEVLKAFAKLLKSSLRSDDMAARWGGDEFVVMFPNTDMDQAVNVAKRVLKQFQQRDFFLPELKAWADDNAAINDLPKLSCSIGIACCDVEQASNLDDKILLKHADKALYKAKAAGKGCVVASSE